MKILHVCAVGFTIRNLLVPQIDYFISQGFEVEAVCAPGQDVDILRNQGYTIHTLPISREINPIANLSNILQLKKLMKTGQYDLVHVHTPIAAVLGRIAAKLAGVPRIVYTAHGFPFHDQSSKFLYGFYFNLEKLSALLSDKILSQSYEDVKTACQKGLCPPHKIEYLGNGIDVERFSRQRLNLDHQRSLRQSLGIPDTAKIILGTIGRLTYKKGSSFLVEAIAQLVQDYPYLHTVIIGGEVKGDPAPFQTKLLQRIQSLNLQNHITLTGYRQDTPELLGLLDIFTLPTFTHEGMPRSILEAMAMELPVVATDIRGCREEVIHGKTGLIVPARDSKSLAMAFKNLIDQPEMRRKFGEAARIRVQKEFDESLVFERLKKVLFDLNITSQDYNLMEKVNYSDSGSSALHLQP